MGLGLINSWNQVAFILLGTEQSKYKLIKGLNCGADAYLFTPIDIRELIARCRNLVWHSCITQNQANEEVLKFKEINLYSQECRVTVRGKEINLSAKEFLLLQMLMKNPGRILPRDYLYEQVWQHNFSQQGNKTLAVHITNLRKRLEVNPRQPEYIVTLRGLGCCLGRMG